MRSKFDTRAICRRLLDAESEGEVQAVIDATPEIADPHNSRFIDGCESTFLSLSTGNKKDIPVVQGKYNMGSSGVLGYCGLKWFKLIVSRRFDGSAPWGFTLMRKRPGGGMPVAEYFVLPTGKIPTFEEDALYPFINGNGKRYDGLHLATA